MTKKSDRVFYVQHGFYADTKDEGRVFFNRGNQHRIGELLTNEQISTFKEAGDIIEDGEQQPGDRIAPASLAENAGDEQ